MNRMDSEPPEKNVYGPAKVLPGEIAIGFLGVGLLISMVICCGGVGSRRGRDRNFERGPHLEAERDAKLDRLREITEEATRPGVTGAEVDRLREEVRRMPIGPSSE